MQRGLLLDKHASKQPSIRVLRPLLRCQQRLWRVLCRDRHQEGNRFSWHSTLHGKADHNGVGKGIGGGGAGWSGPRDWSSSEYGPGASCIDTSKPFQVEVGFPADAGCQLVGMEITLSQVARSNCELKLAIDNYREMPELSKALAAGMTPIVSYWNSADMLWMDGKGSDGQGPCARDSPGDCGKRTKFSNFSVAAIPGAACQAKLTNQQPAKPDLLGTDAPDLLVTDVSVKDSTMAITTTTDSTMAITRSTTLLASEGPGSFEVPIGVVGALGFLAGGLCMSIVFVVMGYIRSRQSQKMQRTLPSSSSLVSMGMQRTLPSSNSIVSMASARELGQQQA